MRDGLKHPDAEERRTTLAGMTAGEVATSMREVHALLDDADWRVRREAALALARLRDVGPAVEPLIDAVVLGDVGRRNAAIEALRHIGPVASAAVLSRLENTSGPPRRFLIEVLGDTGTEACVPVLERLLGDSDGNMPPAATETLGKIAGAASSRALRVALTHADPVVRLAAIQAFATRDETLEWSVLEPLLADPMCRRTALRAAAACPDPPALAAITLALDDRLPAHAAEAAVALSIAAQRGRAEAVSSVLKAHGAAGDVLRSLASRSLAPETLRAIVHCLGLAAHPESIVAVLRASQTPDTSAAANAALDRFGADAVPVALAAAREFGPQARTLMLRWALQHAQPANARGLLEVAWSCVDAGEAENAALGVLVAIGEVSDAERLCERVEKHGAPAVDPAELSAATRRLLTRHGGVAARWINAAPQGSLASLAISRGAAEAGLDVPIEPLLEAMKSANPSHRAVAVGALAASRSPAARDALEYALADEDASVQATAAEALGSLGAGRELLEESLRAAEPRVRQAAARALAKVTGNVRGPLLVALDDPDPSVVLAAIDAMGASVTVDDLRGLTTHAEPEVAAEAVARLRALDAAVAAAVAVRLLDHPAWAVRLEAVRSVNVADESTAKTLRERRSRERDEMVREAIDAVLGRAGGTASG